MNNKYEIKQIPKEDIYTLKRAWEILERGEDMTAFQSFEWFCSVIKDYVPEHVNAYCFYVYDVMDNGQENPILIAPLYIIPKRVKILNSKECSFWGRTAYSDYMNFIYDVFFPDAIDFLFDYIKKQYGIDYFRFDFILEKTKLALYILKSKKIVETHKSTCVHVDLNLTLEERLKRISKHARQNFRTAKNRADKDNLTFVTEFRESVEEEELLIDCYNIWKERLKFKHNRELSTMTFGKRVKYIISNFLSIKYSPPYNVMLKYRNGWLLVVKSAQNTDISGFFWGIHDKQRNGLVVIMVGTNPKYAKYSPGLWGINVQMEHWIEKKAFRFIDFTRGDEKYKYDIGGENHYICEIKFRT